MKKTRFVGLPLSAVLCVLSLGCEEDLGKCDEAEARRLVITSEGQVLYAGQEIMNKACAQGQCHSSNATGDLRQGVPKGLDFNLNPAPIAAAGAASVESGQVSLDATQLARLRKNQRMVFDERNDIWEQIVDGLMPPDGVGKPFRAVNPGAEADLDMPCSSKGKLGTIADKETRSILRNWLACGSPVVEASSDMIAEAVIKNDPAGIPGTVGQQMPQCVASDCDQPLSFDDLYAAVLGPNCASCHVQGGVYPAYDLGDVDLAYKTLTESSGGSEDCNADEAPSVVPGDAASSYIVTKMGGSTPELMLCGALMPYGAPQPLDCGTRQVAAWINAGAPAPGVKVEPDAGM
jgi:mono/diheme cytochrome c family protein